MWSRRDASLFLAVKFLLLFRCCHLRWGDIYCQLEDKMHRKKFIVFTAIILLTGACNSIQSAPVSPTVIQPTNTTVIPTKSPTLEPPTETATPYPTQPILVEPTQVNISRIPIEYEIPIFPGAGDVSYNIMATIAGEPGNSVLYGISASISEVEAFYMEELTQDGWTWVYTETGESLVTSFPAPALIMEFKKGEHKLGIAANEFGGELIMLAGMDISGTELISRYIGAIAGGFDLMGAPESAIKPDALHFSSTLLEFSHPTDWFATDQLMRIFDSDTAINYYPNEGNCSVHMKPCFVTFSVIKGAHFDTPISIRVYPELAGMSLEEANTWRWNELNSVVSEVRYNFPEDLTQAGTLESIEVRTLTLGDGTPAIQRVYRWKQKNVEEFIIGTYTLFTSGDFLVEFHTDFTSETWQELRSIVGQVIASMKINQ
jgi:hypothetical protein